LKVILMLAVPNAVMVVMVRRVAPLWIVFPVSP
jgi:hypothetical protein